MEKNEKKLPDIPKWKLKDRPIQIMSGVGRGRWEQGIVFMGETTPSIYTMGFLPSEAIEAAERVCYAMNEVFKQ